MKISLLKILDEFGKNCMKYNIDPSIISSELPNEFFKKDEVECIWSLKTRSEKLQVTIRFLKDKSEHVFLALQQICFRNKWFGVLNSLHAELKETGEDNLIWQPSVKPKLRSNIKSIHDIRENLKKHYETDFEMIERYWDKFDVYGNFEMAELYNNNIELFDKYKKLKKEIIENFDELMFTKVQRYKQIVVFGGSGCGKSAFVHEIARQWVKNGTSPWINQFQLLFLFRLAEFTKNDTRSVESLLRKCLHPAESRQVCRWLEESKYMESTLFIFDGLDELKYPFCEEVDNMIYGRGVKSAHVLITSRPGRQLEELKETSSSHLFMELKGFSIKGVEKQLEKFEINYADVEDTMKEILTVPLYNTLYCLMKDNFLLTALTFNTKIEKFIKHACDRHRNSNKEFDIKKEEELIVKLGQAVQSTFSDNATCNAKDSIISAQLLSTAISCGLVHPKSSQSNLIFAHQTIAEYCASYYLNKASLLQQVDCLEMKKKELHVGALIGRGGFADVFSGTYQDKPVAIKIYRLPINGNCSNYRDICFQEASLLKSLVHDNILTFVEFIEHIDTMKLHLITELVDGGSMSRFCKCDAEILYEDKKRISKLCWNGLAYLHDQQICHKDIKPDNILISNDLLIVKIADFGMSEIKQIMSMCTTTVKGTCMYYPPEFATESRPLRHPKYSDVYSMGATLCEFFSGKYFWATGDKPKEDAQIMYILIMQHSTIGTDREPAKPTCWENLLPDIQQVLIFAVAPDYSRRKSADEMSSLFDK